jgi:hypothetical protein
MRPLPIVAILAVLAAVAMPAAGEPLTKDSVVNEQGVGAIRIGMTPEEAGAAAGVVLTGDPYELYDDGSCYYLIPEGELAETFGFMVSEGTVARIEITGESPVANAQGARIGDSEQRLLEIYKDAIVEEHAYEGPEGHYVRTKDAGGQHGYVFETDGKVVTRWRAGRYPEIEWIEGCL